MDNDTKMFQTFILGVVTVALIIASAVVIHTTHENALIGEAKTCYHAVLVRGGYSADVEDLLQTCPDK